MEQPHFITSKEGSDNHFLPTIRTLSATGSELHSRPLIKPDLAKIPDHETGRGGSYLLKKGDARHTWSRRYFEAKQSFLYYFAEPTDVQALGVIPLDGCVIRIPDGNQQHFQNHNDASVNSGWEFWVTHSHRRTFCLMAPSDVDRKEWLKSLNRRTSEQALLLAMNPNSNGGSLANNPNTTFLQNININIPGPPPPSGPPSGPPSHSLPPPLALPQLPETAGSRQLSRHPKTASQPRFRTS